MGHQLFLLSAIVKEKVTQHNYNELYYILITMQKMVLEIVYILKRNVGHSVNKLQ